MLLTETLLLAGAGGAIGLYIAYIVPAVLFRFVVDRPPDFPVSPDWRIFAYAFGAVLVTACVSGLIPAYEALNVDLATSLKGCATTLGSGAAGARLRILLVGAQTTLSLVLLVSAGLIGRMCLTWSAADPGYASRKVLVVPLRFPAGYTPDSSLGLFRRIAERLRALPGVQSVSYSSEIPLLGRPTMMARIRGQNDGPARSVALSTASPEYFKTLGIPMLLGRDFHDSDLLSTHRPASVIVSESFVRALCPRQNPIGKRMEVRNGTGIDIIGVAKDVRPLGDDTPRAYLFGQWNAKETFVLVRFAGSPHATARAIRAAARDIDPDLGVTPRPLQAWMDDTLAYTWRIVSLVLTLAFVAAVLAIAGVYGVVTFTVSQRTRELGIRMALGAQRTDIMREVLAFGARPVLGGLLVGLWLSLALTGAVAREFLGVPFRLGAGSPIVYLSASLLLGGAAIIAILVPARRSAQTDVMHALRFE